MESPKSRAADRQRAVVDAALGLCETNLQRRRFHSVASLTYTNTGGVMLDLLVPTLALLFATAQVYADESLKAKAGPIAVETADNLTLQDAARKKELICKVHFPR